MTSLQKFGLVALVSYFALVIPSGLAEAATSRDCSGRRAYECYRFISPSQPAAEQANSDEASIDPKARQKRYFGESENSRKEDADSVCRELKSGQ